MRYLTTKPPISTERDFELKQANILKTAKDFYVKEVFKITNNEISTLKGRRISRTTVSSALYTLNTSDYVVGVTNLGVAPSIGLPRPSLVGMGKIYVIKDEAGGAGATTITVTSDGERTIDGASSTTLTANYQAKSFYCDGSNWFTY